MNPLNVLLRKKFQHPKVYSFYECLNDKIEMYKMFVGTWIFAQYLLMCSSTCDAIQLRSCDAQTSPIRTYVCIHLCIRFWYIASMGHIVDKVPILKGDNEALRNDYIATSSMTSYIYCIRSTPS